MKSLIFSKDKILIILFLISLVIAPFSQAITVYRGDTRGPDDIFQNGFQSIGSSQDLMRHISGASCFGGDRNSGFVSTSRNRLRAFHFAEGTAQETGRNLAYVYEVETNEYFIDVLETLELARHQPAYSSAQRIRLQNYMLQAFSEAELVVRTLIPSRNIISVTIFNLDDGTEERRENPNYVRGTNASPSPLPESAILSSIPPSSINATMASSSVSSPSETVSACFMGGDCGSQQSRSQANKCQVINVPKFTEVTLFEGDIL
ncbi:NAD+ ADP-ribosyltransferase activity [Vibrio sp. B1FIG11]|uniref:scabin-related ADP-ribosyltransferase n=1 Tax=Vibrio sp. B1FIG11 TaxID=2751177 RepID=UPI001AF5AA04|nr:enterotoxin A family protein [Vibrio sp. B1FIG11]CAD7826926.1 NAD+ ADP-ribosyltransferase activity [Vibrio sp. B1FIG11]CAE6962173.1 NAD+ ADP-ribosyltransferase activity [Vibrio sp. B1FIG11]